MMMRQGFGILVLLLSLLIAVCLSISVAALASAATEATVTILVYVDANANGYPDLGEGVDGAGVIVTSPNAIQARVTDANGLASFPLHAGRYTVDVCGRRYPLTVTEELSAVIPMPCYPYTVFLPNVQGGS